MKQLIDGNFWAYLDLAIFSGVFFAWGGIYGIFANTKKIDNKALKRILRIGVSIICVWLWLWIFCIKLLYPISLAKYEYDNNIYDVEKGFVESVELDGKDRINVIIDGVEYKIVYGSADPDSIEIGKDIDKDDYVEIKYGKHSRFIFDFSKQKSISEHS